MALNVTKYLGYFWNEICSQDLSKIAQFGHTGYVGQKWFYGIPTRLSSGRKIRCFRFRQNRESETMPWPTLQRGTTTCLPRSKRWGRWPRWPRAENTQCRGSITVQPASSLTGTDTFTAHKQQQYWIQSSQSGDLQLTYSVQCYFPLWCKWVFSSWMVLIFSC